MTSLISVSPTEFFAKFRSAVLHSSELIWPYQAALELTSQGRWLGIPWNPRHQGNKDVRKIVNRYFK
jgi:hypothetical protein